MNGFSRRLLELLEERNLTQRTFAERIGVREATISRYIHENRTPHTIIASKIADELEVSVDYLLGRSAEMQEPKKPSVSKEKSAPKHKYLEIWNELTEEERREVEKFMYWQKSKRGMPDENAAMGK